MTLAILKREPVVRWMPLGMLVTAALLSIVGPITATFIEIDSADLLGTATTTADSLRENPWALWPAFAIAVVQMLAVYLSRFDIRMPISEFERGLPLSPRRVVLEKGAALWVAIAVPLWFTIPVSALFVSDLPPVPVAAGAALSSAGVALLIALAVGVRFLQGVDELASGRTRSRAAEDSDSTIEARTARSSRTSYVLWRSTWFRFRILVPVSVILAYVCFVPTGGVMRLWFLAFLSGPPTFVVLNLMRGTDALPIARGRVLATAVVPVLVLSTIAGSLGLGRDHHRMSFETLSNTVELDRVSPETWDGERPYAMHVKLPPSAWRTTLTGRAPTVTSPFGESFEPDVHPLPLVDRAGAYNPYDVGEESTVRFLAWQLSRATLDVLGETVTADELLETRFAELDPDMTVGEIRWGHKYEGPVVERTTSLRRASLGAGGLFGLLVSLTVVRVLVRRNQPVRGTRLAQLWHRYRPHAFAVAIFVAVFLVHRRDSIPAEVALESVGRTLDGWLGGFVIGWLALLGAIGAFGWWRIRCAALRLDTPQPVKMGAGGNELALY